jgi:hypothetical protein
MSPLDNSSWQLPLITPLVPEPLSLTWNPSFLCGAILVHPGPRLLVSWPPPPHSLFPPPTVPQSNYAPFYDDTTTPTSLSLAQTCRLHNMSSYGSNEKNHVGRQASPSCHWPLVSSLQNCFLVTFYEDDMSLSLLRLSWYFLVLYI